MRTPPEKIDLVPVRHLFEKAYFIPSYQRGYRWETRQVIDLLDDIMEFQQKEEFEKGEFYCLQPIVIGRTNNGLEVIDGQQRLTTLYLILLYLKSTLVSEWMITETYTLNYETRPDSERYLREEIENIKYPDMSNPDYYHISNAYLTIKNWFESNIKAGNTTKLSFLNTLLDTKENDDGVDIRNNVRFIWYEIDKDEVAEEIFTRINMGKIPLTNSELIKGLFYIANNAKSVEINKYQINMAYEWDRIEYSLQDDKLWFFLNKSPSDKPTRIEFIFDLIANKHAQECEIAVNKNIDKYYTFYIFNELIRHRKDRKGELWSEIKTYFRTFEEWYIDDTNYHLIGYVVHLGEKISHLIRESSILSKTAFREYLISIIKDNITNDFEKRNVGTLRALRYGHDDTLLHKVLLLFNVETSRRSKYVRFPFDRFVDGKWTLEHIHAQNSEDIKVHGARIKLLKEQKDFLEMSGNNHALVQKISKMLDEIQIENDDFRKLQDEIFEKYSDDIRLHGIDNLALLSGGDNSSLSNNIFPIKRTMIKQLDEKGSFIPICTKNVFLKYYSNNVEHNYFWDTDDRDSYFEKIRDMLQAYWTEEDHNED